MSTGPLPTAASAGSPAANAWITNGTRWRIHRTSESGSRPWSCAPPSPSVFTISTTRSLALVAEHADGDDARREAVEDLARRSSGVTWRGLPGAKYEAERVGAEGDREERVLLVGDRRRS